MQSGVLAMDGRRSRGVHVWLLVCAAAALDACGGGSDDAVPSPPSPSPPAPAPGPPPPPSPTPPEVQVSGQSPVAAGCTGGAVAGQAFVHSEVEPWLAIDLNDPRRMLGAWQQDRWSNGSARALVSASSSDGGATCQMHLHPMSGCGGAAPGSSGDFERVTDPWVVFSPDGTAHVMGLATIGPALADGSQS